MVNDKKIINVVYSSDDNYAQPLGVSMMSLLDNFKSDKYKIIINILDGGICYENKNKLLNISNEYSSSINFIKIDNYIFEKFPRILHLSLAAYYRLLIPILMPDVRKCLYLDCDTLIIGNIEGLYEINIDNYFLAAVEDNVANYVLQMDCSFFKYIKRYFNSGVLLLNLEKMRQDNFSSKSIEFTERHSSELLYADQDTLNFLCIDKWLPIDKKYNFQVDRSQEKVNEEIIILHYTTGYKPWHFLYHNYYQKFYRRYLKKWPNYKILKTDNIIVLKQVIKFLPFSVPIFRFLKRKIK